jgi:hypothetical protein
MMYPKHMGPDTQAAELAWLYSSLAAAWSLVAQYQAMEARIEEDRMRENRDRIMRDKMEAFKKPSERVVTPDDEVHPDEGPATSGGQSC